MKSTTILSILVLALVSLSCSDDPQRPTFAFELNQLRAAPDTLAVDSLQMVLEADVWRDFLPGTSDISLQLRVKVVEAEAKEIPEEFTVAQAWVINGSSAWELESQHATRVFSNGLELFFAGGPHWGPDIAVDVVVSILDENGKLYLVQARDQWIFSTV